MPEYIVFVMPPSDGGCRAVRHPGMGVRLRVRHRERGWKACIIDYGTPFVPWRAGRLDGPDIRVMARTCGEACIRARAIGYDCTGFQRMD